MSRSERWRMFIESLKIRRRDRRIAPLTLNYPQQKIWNAIAPSIDKNEPIRVIILKARRQGVSTLAEAILTAFCVESDHVNALVTAHDKKPAAKIWGIAQRYVTTSKLLASVAKIGKDQSGGDVIRFGGSTLEVSTAGTPNKERGGDLTAWHCSELAQYPFPALMSATMQALPDDPRIFSIALLESTAQGKVGKGRLFYREWQRAFSGASEWTAIFIAWHEMPEYRIPGARIDDADVEEKALRIRFELTDEQLAWRRRKIAKDLQGDVDQFRQEYPSYPEEAFVQSGLPFFRPAQLLPMERHLRSGKRFTIDVEGRLTPDPKGYLEIWGMPEMGRRYIVGSDSSMGLSEEIDDDEEGGGRSGSHSRSGAEVLDMETLEQVAEYDAASAPHVMARHLAGIGRLYNEALLAPEVQSSGGGGGRELLVYLHEASYWNIHQVSVNADKIQPQPKIRLGWETNSATRPRMLARVREVVMEQSAMIHSRRLFDQLSSFGENDAGRKVALAGHDDLLFAYGIALMSRSENYYKMPKSEPVIHQPDWKSLGIRISGPGLAVNGEAFIKQQIEKSMRRTPRREFMEL